MKKSFLLLIATIGFIGVTITQNPQWKNYTNGDNIKALIEDEYDLWVGTSMGLVNLDKTAGTPTFYNKVNSGLPNNNITTLTIDEYGSNWIGTNDGLAKFDTNWIIYNSSNSGLPNDIIYAVAIEGNGTKWIGTLSNGLVKFDGISWTEYNSANSGMPNDWVYSIAIDSENGSKWIGTPGDGVVEFDGTNWNLYNASNSGLPWDNVLTIIIDQNGCKWIGTSGGLAKFDNVNWTVYNTMNSGLPNNFIKSLAIDDIGILWIGTNEGGLVKFDGVNWTIYNSSNSGLPYNNVKTIAIDGSGMIWIGIDLGVYFSGSLSTFDGTSWTTYYEFPVSSIIIDENDVKWLDSGWDLVKIDGTIWTTYNVLNSGLPAGPTSLAIDEHGSKWIGTYLGGLAVYNENGIPVTIEDKTLPISNISIFPNPASDVLNIELLSNVNISLVEIINMQGKVVFSQKMGYNKNSINVSCLPLGVYIVKVHSDKGITMNKFIKQ